MYDLIFPLISLALAIIALSLSIYNDYKINKFIRLSKKYNELSRGGQYEEAEKAMRLLLK